MTFEDFNLDPDLLEGLFYMGFNQPTPIQEQAIPLIMSHKDLVACAQTGTGKTAAFILPLLHKIINSPKRHLNTLVLVPTRELVMQIDQQLEGFSYYAPVSVMPVYGGGDGATWEQQKKALKEGVDMIIATPGRLLAQMASQDINLQEVEHLVLDEADRMLDMGFYNDIMSIINRLPKKRQTLLFSATMPPKIRSLTNKILNQPEEVNVAISKPAEGVQQQAYMVYDDQKENLIKQILKSDDYQSVLIFASTKKIVNNLSRALKRMNLMVEGFHSDLEQPEREELMRKFKNRMLRVLIGTDILSRGIDVEGISLVINYDSPGDPEDYIHRIGRTARADTEGVAITLINEKDQRKFYQIENMMGKEVPKLALPEGLGKGPEYNPVRKNSSKGKRKPWNKKKKFHKRSNFKKDENK
ncbi:DEAD/DEAH box helicase [Rapidithrix thailandica]|uniref:DEAD/DEAH box helicase n=1 Tax=Rapidithrix thailandica TaxID=413964 RepID=A0AAW9S3C9_9BACT